MDETEAVSASGMTAGTDDIDLKAEPSPIRGISRNVFVFGIVSLLADISSEILYPLIPYFVTTTLGAPVATLGAIEGLAEGTASVMKGVAGWWSDRISQRKSLVMAGYALAAVGKLLLAMSFVWPQALVARFVDRFGKGVRTSPRDAMIADSTAPENYGRAFGFHRAADTAGAVLGPLVGLAALAALGEEHLRPIFLIAVIPAVVSVLFILPARDRRRGPAAKTEPLRLDLSGAGKGFWMLLGVSVLFALGNSSDTFLLLRSGNLGLALTEVILVYVLYNASWTLLAMPAGILSDRVQRRWLLAGGWVIFALVYAGFAATSSAAPVWPLFAVYGVYMALTDGVARAFVADFAPEERRATFMGAYNMSVGLAALAASVTAGLLFQFVAPAAPFWLGASTALAAAALLVALPVRKGAD